MLLCFLAFLAPLQSAEIASNGTGGGPWSDPASWRGGKLPTGDDEVVVRKFDAIAFDRGGDPVVVKKLQIDPKGTFTFKPNSGVLTLVLQDALECYGSIKLDGTRSATDSFEIRFAGPTQTHRQIKLAKGAALLLYGKTGLAKGERNVRIVAVGDPKDVKTEAPGMIDTDGGVSLDFRAAAFKDVKIAAKKLDNTGSKANERMQISDCVFEGQARVYCHTVDTPVVVRNTFDYAGTDPLAEAAIGMLFSPLAEIKGNRVRGKFAVGITVNYQTDSSVLDNVVEGCAVGVQGGYGIPNTMIRNVAIKDCDAGIKLEGASGVVEDAVIENAKLGISMINANLQFHRVRLEKLDPKGIAFDWNTGTVTLLDCGIKLEQVKWNAPAAPPPGDTVVVRQSVVIESDAPEGALVEVRTVGIAADVPDANVRNSPAPLIQGKTPGPKMFNAIQVRSAALDAKGKIQAGPEYQVKLLGPAAKEGDVRPVLKTMNWRPSPDMQTPTIKISAK